MDSGGPVPVVVAKVTQKDVPIEVSVVGNVEAFSTITIIPQVGGQLMEVDFKEGDIVKKGQKLFVIDQRPLEATLAQNVANLARDKALLSQAEANLARDIASEKYARVEAERYTQTIRPGHRFARAGGSIPDQRRHAAAIGGGRQSGDRELARDHGVGPGDDRRTPRSSSATPPSIRPSTARPEICR